jgi:hypothetical protein
MSVFFLRSRISYFSSFRTFSSTFFSKRTKFFSVTFFSRANFFQTGYTSAYNWVIPSLADIGEDVDDGHARCALRIRYNISSEDYYGYSPEDPVGEDMIDSRFNAENSPIEQNPYVGYGSDGDGYEWELRLALNTDQYGRTFEDR